MKEGRRLGRVGWERLILMCEQGRWWGLSVGREGGKGEGLRGC